MKKPNQIKKAKEEATQEGLTLWKELKKSNEKDIDSLQDLMRSAGYTPGEIQLLSGKAHKAKPQSRIDQLKQDIYLRHQLRIRLLFDLLEDNPNIISIFGAMQREEEHVVDQLQRLGDTPATTEATAGFVSVKGNLESLVYGLSTVTKGKPYEPLPVRTDTLTEK